MTEQAVDVEELADDIILPHLKDMPGTTFTVGSLLAMADDGLPEDAPDLTLKQVEDALDYLQSGGEVLHLAGKGWTAI